MSLRVLIGSRGGSRGLFVSKPGFDAGTAGDDDLLLGINERTAQRILTGVTVFGGFVPYDLPQRPVMLLTAAWANPSVSPYVGFIRPFPFGSDLTLNCQAIVGANGATMFVGIGVILQYSVFRKSQ